MPSAARSLAITTAATTIGLVASLIVTVAAPRVLGTEELALFFAATSALAVTSQVGTLGLGEVLMRGAARSIDGAERTRIVVASGLSLVLGGVLVSLVTIDTFGSASLLLAIWVPIAGLGRLVSVAVRLQGADLLASVIGEIARRVGMTIGLVVVWALGASWQGVAVAGMVGELVLLAIGSRATAPSFRLAGWWRSSLGSLAAIWRQGAKHAVAGMPRLVITTAGPLALTIRLGQSGAADIAQLGMASRLLAIGGLLTVSCARALAAWTVRAATDEVARADHRRRVRRWSAALMVLSLIPGVLAARPEFTTLIFGEQGELISAWTAVLMAVAVACSSGAALRYQEVVVNLGPDPIWRPSIAIVVGWTGLALALAEPFGAEGVAAASAIASIGFLALLITVGRRGLPAAGERSDASASSLRDRTSSLGP